MDGHPDGRTDGEGGRWLPLADAAAVLGLRSGEALRGRIRRNRTRYRTRRTDRGDLMVWVTSADGHPDGRTDVQPPQPDAIPDPRDAELAALRATVEGLHGRVTALQALAEAQRQHIADVRGELAEVKTERDRLLAVVERLAERPERQRWSGLLPALRRFWRGEE